VTIFFPDPWYKHKHEKRRLITEQLVSNLYEFMREEGELYVESDHVEGLQQSGRVIEAQGGFERRTDAETLAYSLRRQSDWGRKMNERSLTDPSIRIESILFMRRKGGRKAKEPLPTPS